MGSCAILYEIVHSFFVLSILGALNRPLGTLQGEVAFRPIGEQGIPAVVARHRRFSVSSLELELVGENRFRIKATTDAEGRFSFTGLPLGHYSLRFKNSAGQPFSTKVSLSSSKPARAFSLDLIQNMVGARNTLLKTEEIRQPRLRNELLAIFSEDQLIRQKWIAGDVSKDQPKTLREMEQINLRQVSRVQGLVSRHGWLGPKLVGFDGSKGAFLVIQHAPPTTQIRWYPVLERAFRKGELPPDEFAMFTDRVLLAKGKKQRFGTVALPPKEWIEGEPVFQPIEDPTAVDGLRASVGLPPLAEYKELLRTMYRPGDVNPKGLSPNSSDGKGE